jgi:hypothetical protein
MAIILETEKSKFLRIMRGMSSNEGQGAVGKIDREGSDHLRQKLKLSPRETQSR